MDTRMLLDLFAQQQHAGFADVAGTEAQGTFRVSDHLLNQIIATELRSGALREVQVRGLDRDRLSVRLVLAKPSFLPPLTVGVTIERQPSLPDDPVLALRLDGIGGLTRLAGPAALFLNVLPPGVRMEGDRVFVDLRVLLQRRNLELVLQYLEDLRVNAEPGAVRVSFRARVR